MKTLRGLFSRYKFLLILLVISFVAGKPLLQPGFPPTHDGEYHVIRFYEFDKALRDGNIYPRWAADLNNGYGVPLFNYVYPLPNYVSSLLHTVGVSFIDAFKLNLFFAIVIGAILFYLWAKLYWGNAGGITAATFYTFTPYHFVDIYVRGSVGEVWALAFFPGFLWAVTLMFREKNRRFMIVAGVFLALIIFSHNILAEMFFIFSAAYCFLLCIISKQKRVYIIPIFGVYLIGIGLSTVFWLPALTEIQFVRGLQVFDISRNFPELYQLLIPSWGTGFSGGSLDSEMSFQIGVANLLAVFFSLIFLFKLRKVRDRQLLWVVLFYLFCFGILFFLMLPISLFIWNSVPFFNFFQFPWRFLSLMMVVTSFLAGFWGYIFSSQSKKWIASLVVCLLCIALSYVYTFPAYYHMRDDAYYVTRDNFIKGTNSPGNSFNTVWFQASSSALPSQRVLRQTSSYRKFSPIVDRAGTISVNIAYFPGWTVHVDGKRVPSHPDEHGLLSFTAPRGTSIVEAQFNDTIVRGLAMFVSLLTVIIVTVLYIVAI